MGFVPKTIVKFSLAEPIDDKQMLKKKVRSAFLFPVTYVDADVGRSEYHVRCSDEEQAKKTRRRDLSGKRLHPHWRRGNCLLGEDSEAEAGEETEVYSLC